MSTIHAMSVFGLAAAQQLSMHEIAIPPTATIPWQTAESAIWRVMTGSPPVLLFWFCFVTRTLGQKNGHSRSLHGLAF